MPVVSLFMIRLISGVRCYQPDPTILHSLLALHLIVLAATDIIASSIISLEVAK